MFTLNFGKKAALAALVFVGSMTVANAASTPLDTFDYTLEASSDAVGVADSATAYNVNDFGGDVNYTVTRTSLGGDEAKSEALLDGALGGILDYSNTSRTLSILEILYTDLDNSLTGPLDLEALGSAFYFDVIYADAGFELDVIVGSDTGVSSYMTENQEVDNLTSGIATRSTVGFDAFSTVSGTGADFTSVDFVKIILTSTLPSIDLTLTEYGVVPEPTSLAILGLGLLGFVASRRKNV